MQNLTIGAFVDILVSLFPEKCVLAHQMLEKKGLHLFHFTSGKCKMDVESILNNTGYATELDNMCQPLFASVCLGKCIK